MSAGVFRHGVGLCGEFAQRANAYADGVWSQRDAQKATLAWLSPRDALPTRRRVAAAAAFGTEQLDIYTATSDSDVFCTDVGTDLLVEDMDFGPYGRIGFFIEWARDIDSLCLLVDQRTEYRQAL